MKTRSRNWCRGVARNAAISGGDHNAPCRIICSIKRSLPPGSTAGLNYGSNPKVEYRNSKQIRNSKHEIRNTQRSAGFELGISNFGFRVSDFGFDARASGLQRWPTGFVLDARRQVRINGKSKLKSGQ